MANLNYLKRDPNDNLFRYVKRMSDGGRIVYEGTRYERSRNVKVSKLVPIFEKEIASLVKNGELPELELNINLVKQSKLKQFFQIEIVHVDASVINREYIQSAITQEGLSEVTSEFVTKHYRKITNDLGDYVLFKIGQMLWKFNRESFFLDDEKIKHFYKRFYYHVSFSKELVNEQNEQLKVAA